MGPGFGLEQVPGSSWMVVWKQLFVAAVVGLAVAGVVVGVVADFVAVVVHAVVEVVDAVVAVVAVVAAAVVDFAAVAAVFESQLGFGFVLVALEVQSGTCCCLSIVRRHHRIDRSIRRISTLVVVC